MVELYEAYADYNDAATRLEGLVGAAAKAAGYAGELDFATTPWRRVSFAGAIQDATGIDVRAHREADDLRAAIAGRGLEHAPPRALPGRNWPTTCCRSTSSRR